MKGDKRMARSVDERIRELQERQAELKAKEKNLIAKQQQEKRKRRTQKLIIAGAETVTGLEKIIGREIQEEDLQKIIGKMLSFLRYQNERGGYFSKWMNRDE